MPYTVVNVTALVTASTLRADLPEFADPGVYTDGAIAYWSILATLLMNASRWGNLLQLACELFIAHNLVLEAMDQQTALEAGWPGVSKGAINSESVGPITVAYTSEPTLETDGGHWNLTKYGTRLLRLIRMAGAGPVQVGPGSGLNFSGIVPLSSNTLGPAFTGPSCWPGWFS